MRPNHTSPRPPVVPAIRLGGGGNAIRLEALSFITDTPPPFLSDFLCLVNHDTYASFPAAPLRLERASVRAG
jgi:hypothetical protein